MFELRGHGSYKTQKILWVSFYRVISIVRCLTSTVGFFHSAWWDRCLCHVISVCSSISCNFCQTIVLTEEIFQVITKTLALFIHSNDYNQLTQELERFWRFETEEEFKNKVNKTLAWIYKGAVVCVVYLHVATFLFMLISVFSSRTMPFYSYVPKFLSRKFLSVFECSTFSTMALCAFCFDYINFIYLQLIIIQFKLINAAISKLNIERGQNQSNFRPEMVKIIKHHIFLLDYIDRLNQIMSLPLFFQVFNSIPSLCFELYLLKSK